MEFQVKCDLCSSKQSSVLFNFPEYRVLSCGSCGLVFTDSSVYSRDLEIYSGDYYKKKYPKRYDSYTADYRKLENDSIINNYTNLLEQLEKFSAKGKMLDVGCATGVFLDIARERGWEVQGIDVSKYAVHYARKNFGLKASVATIENLKAPDSYFDVITLHEVIEHVPSMKSVLKGARKKLKKNGLLLLTTIDSSSLISQLSGMLYHSTLGKINSPAQKCFQLQHTFHPTPEIMRLYFKEAGFKEEWFNRSEIPVDKLQEGPLMTLVIGAIYLLQKLTGKTFLFEFIARKV